MDPVFIYEHDPGTYWAIHRLENQLSANITSKSPPSTTPTEIDTYDFLSEINANYFLINSFVTPEIYTFANNDSRFRKLFEQKEIAIFQLE